jgi:hypothetical protein
LSVIGESDPGVVRAGAAAAERRRELDISQRSLAADGIIKALSHCRARGNWENP